MFPFYGNIIFSELSFKRKCKKAASFRKCVILRKYEIFVYDSCQVMDANVLYVFLLSDDTRIDEDEYLSSLKAGAELIVCIWEHIEKLLIYFE